MKYPDFKVCVRCFTFNQSEYITDAMNGFTMQQTSFPFVCTIVDDASTDGEQEVISKYVDENFDWSEKGVSYTKETDYAHILYAQHKTNKNCYFAVLLLKENHYSIKKPKLPYLKEWDDEVEFIALCEGDDYWTNENKLQRQYSFMTKNPDFSLCFHKVEVKAEEGRIATDIFGYLTTRDYYISDCNEMFKKWLVPTGSIMHKAYISDKLPSNPNFKYGDNVLIAACLSEGPIHCIGESMGVYRLVTTGYTGTHQGVKFAINQIPHLKALQEEFEFYKCPTIYKYLEGYYFQYLKYLRDNGNTSEFEALYEDYKTYFDEIGISSFRLYCIKKNIRGFLSNIKKTIKKAVK